MDLLAAFRKDGRSAQIERLLEENNSLMRELLAALGRQALTPRSQVPRPPLVPRDASHISVVSRQSVLQRERETEAQQQAPWRGPASDPTSPSDGAPTPASSDAASSPAKS